MIDYIWATSSYVGSQILFPPWRGFSLFLFIFTLVESSPGIGISSNHFVTESKMLYRWPIFTAGIFVFFALVLSMLLIFEHLAVYKKPEEQKFLIGLILMVPVYASESFLSLVDSSLAFNCEVMRDCYEAFALYCFERYLIACLGGERNTIEYMEHKILVSSSIPLLEAAYAGVIKHPFPLNCLLKPWYLGADFYQAVKVGIVQYMILKLICAFLAMILEFFGLYGEGQFKWRYGYPYLAVILNFSQTWALYCLMQFYSVTKEKLEPIEPLAKFLVFKSIVFLTWWQGVAIAFLSSIGFFRSALAQQLKARIQDYIICIEMGIAAAVHMHVFPAKPYRQGERCINNVSVLADYASLGTLPDPDEVRDCERSTTVRFTPTDEREKRPSLPHRVRDVVLGSGEIIADDVKFTVTHVVQPFEQRLTNINKTLHQISENVRRHEKWKRKSKDDSYLIPLQSWKGESLLDRGSSVGGSVSDSGLNNGKRRYRSTKIFSPSWRNRKTRT